MTHTIDQEVEKLLTLLPGLSNARGVFEVLGVGIIRKGNCEQGIVLKIGVDFYKGTGRRSLRLNDDVHLKKGVTSAIGIAVDASFKSMKEVLGRFWAFFAQIEAKKYDVILEIEPTCRLETNEYLYIDGGSIGLPVGLACISKFTKIPTNPDAVYTGAVDSDGKIKPVEGIELKARAVANAGKSLFVVPGENTPELTGRKPPPEIVHAGRLYDVLRFLGG